MNVSGEINVVQVLEAWRRERISQQAWLARLARWQQREEERAVLRAWWQAPERDRETLVQRHRTVFARIKANRRRAARLYAQERALNEAWKRRLGFRTLTFTNQASRMRSDRYRARGLAIGSGMVEGPASI